MNEVIAHPEHTSFCHAASRKKLVNRDSVFDGCRATVSWPACVFYEGIMKRSPNARVIF